MSVTSATVRDPRSTDALTPSLRSKGYTVALTPKTYEALEAEHRAGILAAWASLTEVERIAVMLAGAEGVEPRHRVTQALAVHGMGFRVSVAPGLADLLTPHNPALGCPPLFTLAPLRARRAVAGAI